jgi:hypothetical protein
VLPNGVLVQALIELTIPARQTVQVALALWIYSSVAGSLWSWYQWLAGPCHTTAKATIIHALLVYHASAAAAALTR